ncbi:MAG: acetolactate synthase-1/2/3 large subunit [Candidatus Woesearchaeota archaeon]|jgi:acetolactate synthase-1/2/3 large subunit
MKASDIVVDALVKQGVTKIFGVPGEENLDLLESIRSSPIEMVVTRHEQTAAMIAATYGRLTGKIGVCLSTLGPGATNLVTGIAYAQLGGMPLLAITGQKGIRENWQANFQVIDIVEMMKPITQYAVSVKGPKTIGHEIRKACKIATTERMGAVHIEIPEDVCQEHVDPFFQGQVPGTIRRPQAAQKTIDLLAQKIRDANNPIIIVSSRAQRNMVRDALRDLCDTTNLFVIHTQLGKGVLGDDHKNSLFAFGIHKKDYVNCVVDKSDLIITVGYSTSEHPPSVWNKHNEKDIVHIDFTPTDGDIYFNPSIEIIGDIATSLRLLKETLVGYQYNGDYETRIKHELEHKLFIDGATDDSYPLKPRRIVAECRKILDTHDIICMDNGIYKLWFSRHYPTYNIGTFLIDNTLATMGAGLPSAIGAKIVHPDKKVITVCGDGGFMMNSQELETAVRLKLNVVVLLVNDNAFGFIKWKQKNHKFADYALDLQNPDFVAYAKSYGAHGYKVNQTQDLQECLRKAFTHEGPVIIECPIDYSENQTVWNQELDELHCPL